MQKNVFKKIRILLASWRSIEKIEGSGSASGTISQRHGSPDPDPHQNIMDPEHWPVPVYYIVFSLHYSLMRTFKVQRKSLIIHYFADKNRWDLKMEDEVMRFEITDQDLEDEMTSSYGHKRYRTFQRNYRIWYGTTQSRQKSKFNFSVFRIRIKTKPKVLGYKNASVDSVFWFL